MSQVEIIPTKFPKQDVQVMDELIRKGSFISRSDLIREAAREKMKQELSEQSGFERLVRVMKQKGDFDSMEGKALAALYLEQDHPQKMADFSPAEQKALRKLLLHPFKIVQNQSGMLVLTENGKSVARGFLKGLAFAQTLTYHG